MSLINQMLRDLQQQKKADGQSKPDSLRPKMMERIPYLPLPVVLGGAALVLLCLVWWLAGILSDMMFGFEPVMQPKEDQQIVVEEYVPTVEKETVVMEEHDQLTLEEREAEPPLDSAPSELVVAKNSEPVNKQTLQKKHSEKPPVVKPVTSKPATIVSKPSASVVPTRKKVAASPRQTRKPQLVQRRSVQPPAKVVAKTHKRMHPDDLPGAIASSSYSSLEPKDRIDRPSRSEATTPYGKAEEAYLDAKWALAHDHKRTAIRSLHQSLQFYPGHLPAREMLAETLSQEGKAGEAMALFSEGLEIAPDYIVFKKKYARLLEEKGDSDAATQVMLSGGMPPVEDDPEAHVILASLYQNLGEPFLAAQTYRNLLVAWPQTGAFWVGLGGALEGQQLSDEAIVCYQRALNTKSLRKDLAEYAKKRLSVLN